MSADKVYTVKECAEYLHMTERAIYNFIKDGRLTGSKVGRVWLIKQRWIDDFLDAQIARPGADPEPSEGENMR
jgi:excisionase family DNA binding protein